MAGVVPKRTNSSRRQWALHDGPSDSLNRLRSQFASEGCPESQVVLAKQLLDSANDGEPEAARLAVYWLIKASEQANEEATQLLIQCMDTRKGITELNFLDVKNCLSMPLQEKLCRQAARELFQALSNGGEFVTTGQLECKMLPDEGLNALYACAKVTENEIVVAASDYSNGLLPSIVQPQGWMRPILEMPSFSRSILHPLYSIQIFFWSLVHAMSTFKMKFVFILWLGLIIRQRYDDIFMACNYTMALILMVVGSARLLQLRRNFGHFRLWSRLFLCHAPEASEPLDAYRAEMLFLRNNLQPYVFFFVGALMYFTAVPPPYTIFPDFQCELAVFSFLMACTMVALMAHGEPFAFLSFGINLLARYPYNADEIVSQGWRFLDLRWTTSDWATTLSTSVNWAMQYSSVLSYTLVPTLLVLIAQRERWAGVYKLLCPHLVALTWLQVCLVSAQNATMFGLIRAVLGVVGFMTVVPLVGVVTILISAYSVTQAFVTRTLFLWLGTGLVAALGLVLATRFAYKRYTGVVQVCVCTLSIFILLQQEYKNASESTDHHHMDSGPDALPWQVYQRYCHQPTWQDDNMALAQMKCLLLDGAPVQWDGYVSKIEIMQVANIWNEFLPKFTFCWVGGTSIDALDDECENVPTAQMADCEAFVRARRSISSCSLDPWNRYLLSVHVKMEAGLWASKHLEVVLDAGHEFTNFSLALKPNDHIWFHGTLKNDQASILGGNTVKVALQKIGCVACTNERITEMVVVSNKVDFIKSVTKTITNLIPY